MKTLRHGGLQNEGLQHAGRGSTGWASYDEDCNKSEGFHYSITILINKLFKKLPENIQKSGHMIVQSEGNNKQL